MNDKREISIEVPVLTRVEGEGALEFTARHGRIEDMKLRIYEPPRLFEKFLEGRSYTEIPDVVARICGICPVAYQMSAVHAIEQAFGVRITPWIRAMRRVLYCGEWLQSHSLHVHLLAAPDFLGYDNAIAMAAEHGEAVRRGMRLQGVGNQLISLFGGRSVHPVGVRVGGFFHAPTPAAVAAMLKVLDEAVADAEALIAWTATLPTPDDAQDFSCVALHHPDEYPFNEGRLVSSSGLDIAANDYQKWFREFQVPHSTALHATLNGQPYLVGPLARVNLNWDLLPGAVRDAVAATGIKFPSRNMFHSIVARAAEIYFAILEARRLLSDYAPAEPAVAVAPRAAIGYGCTEAPRGILWQCYEFDPQGHVKKAIITPPTSQNQARIEADLRNALESYGLEHSDEELRLRGEAVIRNYDPCISCSTHFLRIKVKR